MGSGKFEFHVGISESCRDLQNFSRVHKKKDDRISPDANNSEVVNNSDVYVMASWIAEISQIWLRVLRQSSKSRTSRKCCTIKINKK